MTVFRGRVKPKKPHIMKKRAGLLATAFRAIPAHASHQTLRISLSLAAALGTVASAADVTWTGSEDDNWNNPDNWDAGRVPVEPSPDEDGFDNAIVNDVSANIPVISGDVPALRDPFIGSGAGADGRVDHTAGTLTANGWSFVGRQLGTGVYNLADTSAAGGAFTGYGEGSGSFNAGGRLYVGGHNDDASSGTGTFNMNTSGSLTAGELHVGNGHGGEENPASTAVFNLDAGTVITDSWTMIGRQGATGTFNMSGGELRKQGDGNLIVGDSNGGQGTFVQTGGAVNVNEGEVWIAQGGGGTTGTYTISDGSLTVDNWMAVGREGAVGELNIEGGTITKTGDGNLVLGTGATGMGTITQTGGTISVNSETWLAEDALGGVGTGVYALEGGTANLGVLRVGQNSTASGTFHLRGGELNVSEISSGSTGTRVFNFDGGILRPTGSSESFMNMGEGSAASVLEGGAIIDTNGHDVTIGQTLVHGGSDPIDGGLTKQGEGTLTLTGNNTYTGATTVSAGTLLVNGTLGTGDVIVSSGATLGGDNILAGDLVVSGTLAPGNSIGTTTVVGSLTLAAGSLTSIELSPTAMDADRINIGGDLNIDPSAQLALSLFGSDQALAFGETFIIADYEGTWNGVTFDGVADDSVITLGVNQFQIDYDDVTVDGLTGTGVTLTVIPEPSAALLAALGAIGLLRRRR